MKNILTILAIFTLLISGFAQEIPKEALFEDKNDPEAKVILDKVSKKYEAYKSIEIDFDMTVEIPEEDVVVQKGKMIQYGDKYFLDIPQIAIYCDGKVIWKHLKNQKQVQINDYEEDEENEDIMSPKDILKIYKGDKYFYVLMNEAYEKGVMIQQIEFKPKDRDSEYSKMRVTINKNTSEIMHVKVFSRDGSRFSFAIETTKLDKKYGDDTFVFVKSKAPDSQIEDLRTD
jgi:outer membrane lipoprotein-sorting protein